MDFTDLPAVNATLNGISTVLLTCGWITVRRRALEAHKRFMLGACITSALFLVSYLMYHYNVGSVPYPETGLLRTVYLSILLTHIVLAVVIVPLVVMTLVRAAKNQLDRHKKVARWTLPLWLYVSVTGVVIFAMLKASGAYDTAG